eukprot:CAMPEP_0198281248 /NCGR_PEP_ID=MMETSP1449-20131203/1220_1 /TAXON_ID=420275 /ORGANISM="Attheya septentrionalis, Strain CCMP2084" /LENGTH=491 /DNA_ID=CAMNT_0043976953 /DNA_START=172 /DNA_END=1644 /DNA_ORIENTATION=-
MTVTSSSAPATTSKTDGLSLESALQFCGITRNVMQEWGVLEAGRDERDDDSNGANRAWNQTDPKSKMGLAKGVVDPNNKIVVIEPYMHQHRLVMSNKWKCAVAIAFLFSVGISVACGVRVFTTPDEIVSDDTIKNTPTPTVAPTTDTDTDTFSSANVTLHSPFPLRQNDLFELAMRVSGAQALKDVKSPAYSALEWMLEKKELIYESMATHETLERYSLGVLYFSLHDEIFSDMKQRRQNEDPFEDGETLNTRSTWLSHGHHCEWKGISCNDRKCVTHIHLRGQQLGGSLPNAELAQFSYLHTLDLGQNKLRGKLPNGLYKLKTLKHLYLHDNRFSGSISRKIKNMKNLASIYIGDNLLDGSIPSSLKEMHNLRSVSMLRNKLTGTVPTFGKNTLYLDLGSNYLEGPLPSDITIYPELTMLYLDHNTFQGTVPKLYAKHSGIQQLWLNNNKFTGTFPDFSSTAALLTIRSEGNDLTIGKQICELSAMLGVW